MKNKRNLNTKWLLLQNDQNADTTLLHSHDEMWRISMIWEGNISKFSACHTQIYQDVSPKELDNIAWILHILTALAS